MGFVQVENLINLTVSNRILYLDVLSLSPAVDYPVKCPVK